MTKSALDRLGLYSLVPDGHALDFERLWRIKAAGGDAKGVLTNPVLCRAVGAYRHSIDGIAVLGRASMTAEVAGDASLTRVVDIAMRHVSGDGGGKRIGEVAVSGGGDAATSVVTQLHRAFGKGKTGDVRFTAEAFEFGYLSLGRRRQQSALAPFYVARISVDHGPEAEATAHVFAVPASKERFVRSAVEHGDQLRRDDASSELTTLVSGLSTPRKGEAYGRLTIIPMHSHSTALSVRSSLDFYT